MGGTSYSSFERTTRSNLMGYNTKSVDQIFEQNKKREAHESMKPRGVTIRESRDSAAHPNSVPIIIALDTTGSMQQIPHEIVKTGLPHIMETIIGSGIPDPQILFMGVGDDKVDRAPLQIGQFESGDLELDTWLTRTYLEGGGGGNGGESYSLAWYFAANHTVTDAWEKRRKKGFLFTIGDEPCHVSLPKNVVESIMGNTVEAGFTDAQLLNKAQETYEVYHLIVPTNNGRSQLTQGYWKELLGDRAINVDHKDIAKVISKIVVDNVPDRQQITYTPSTAATPGKADEIYL